MPHLPASADAPDLPQVPFNTGCLGCLFVVMVVVTAVFVAAAFDAGLFANLADTAAPRNWLGVLAPFSFGGVNIAVLLLAAYLAWEGIKLGWRFIDMKAVWIEGDTIRFHPTLRQQAIPVADVLDVTLDADDMRSALVIRQAGGRRIEVAMVDHDAAAVFIRDIEPRLADSNSA